MDRNVLSSHYSLRCCQCLKASNRAWVLKHASYPSVFPHKTPTMSTFFFYVLSKYPVRRKPHLNYPNTFQHITQTKTGTSKWRRRYTPAFAPTHTYTHIRFLSAYTGDLIIGSDLTGDRLFILLTSLHFHINTGERFLLKRKELIFKHRGKKAPAEKYITLFNVLKSNWVQQQKAEGLVFVEIGDYSKKNMMTFIFQ